MKKTTMVAAMAGLALAAGSASAQVFSSSPFLPINDVSTQSDTINVSGGPSSITDVNVIVQATHTWDSDIDMVLQGPSGYVLLTSDNGGSGDNYLTTRFDDAAPTSITAGVAPFDGNFRPETTYNGWSGTAGIFTGTQYTSLSGFNGGDSNGAWTLWIADGVGGDVGTLQYWSMEFNFAADPNDPNPPPPPPTVPSGIGSYVSTSIPTGSAASFRVTVTGAINPNSTGLGVTVDASPFGLGTITLLDDGVNDDGIAGNNVFGRDTVIDAPEGDYILNFTVSDAQNRSSSGSFPSIHIQPPPPTCPDYDQPMSFTNLTSYGPIGDPGNSVKFFSFTGSSMVTEFHVSGRIISGGTGTFLTEARLHVGFSDGTFADLQVFPTGTTFTLMDVFDATLPLPVPHLASEILSVETFESFNDAGLDATWSTICFTTKAAQTNPNIVAASVSPTTSFPSAVVHFAATVAPGANPASTGLAVTADASATGAGTVTLLDDGIQDDGIAGNGVYGADFMVPAASPGGVLTIPFNASDAEGRVANTVNATLTVNVPAQWEEHLQGAGDAGETVFDPQSVTGSGSLTSLGGEIEFAGSDSDLFLINICDPANFSADSSGGTGTLTDTQLWLFKTDGSGVEFNDDTVGVRSRIDATFVTDPGNYILGISGYNRDAVDADGSLIWNNTPFAGVRAPDGPGAFNPLAGWAGTSASGTYQINLTGSCFVQGTGCDPDLNQDGNVDQGDVDYLINVVAGGDNYTGIDPDFNHDGNVDQGDIDALLNVVAGGQCP